MAALILRRIIGAVPVLFALSLLVWGSVLLVPGDPAVTLLGDDATFEQIDAIRKALGLDQPLIRQYVNWLSDAVTGDLGVSYFTGRSVSDEIATRLPVTLSLTAIALLFSVTVGFLIGLAAALRPGSILDRFASLLASVAVAMPNFWLAGVAILVAVVWLDLLPSVGYVPFTDSPLEWLKHMILPAMIAGSAGLGEMIRQVREAVLEQLSRDYARTSRAYGASTSELVRQDVLKNSAVSLFTLLGVQCVRLLGGTIVVERIFGLPGIGSYMIQVVMTHDYRAMQGVILFVGVVSICINLAVDITYRYVAPWSREDP